MHRLAERVLADLSASGFEADTKGAVASNPLFARSIEAWEEAAHAWVEDPDRDRGLMLLCVVVESDPVWGSDDGRASASSAAFARSPNRELLLRRLAQAALAVRPPTGFRRHRVLLWSGERKVLDIKKGGPAADRVAGALERPGRRRGRGHDARTDRSVARRPGRSLAEDAAVLRDAFELVCELRMEHQVESAAQRGGARQPDRPHRA